MKIIIDTHLLIFREYDSFLPEKYHKILQLFNKSNCQIYVHPLSLQELANDNNLKNRDLVLSKVKTYLQIDNPPDAKNDHEFQTILQLTDDFNDQIDDQLLYCVYKNYVDYLITEDDQIHIKSEQLKISDKILTIEKALNLLEKGQATKSDNTSTSRHHYSEFSFYRNGDYWLIGKKGNERQIKDLAGLRFISFLLKYPNHSFTPTEVYHEKKYPEFESNGDQNGFNVTGDILKLKIDKSGIPIAKIKYLVTDLETKIEEKNFEGFDDLTEAENQLKLLKSYLKNSGIRDHKSESEKARVNVTRRIKMALEKINNMVPEVALYLNSSTIKSGDNFSYSPVVGQEPIWKLIP